MTQAEIDRAVATATQESVADIHRLGFSLANPLEVHYDPEPRRPLVYDWDERRPAEWLGD